MDNLHYVLLMPSGELRGFKDIDSARGTVYEYDLRTILENVQAAEWVISVALYPIHMDEDELS